MTFARRGAESVIVEGGTFDSAAGNTFETGEG